jgi:hypothetical protein
MARLQAVPLESGHLGAQTGLECGGLTPTFLAELAWPADAALLAKAVAPLPHSKAWTFGPYLARLKACPDMIRTLLREFLTPCTRHLAVLPGF